MNLRHPMRVVTPTVDGDVLAVLARAAGPFTVPQVHNLVGQFSESGVRKTLQRLSAEGIVLRERVGNAWIYTLNRDHLAAPYVIGLADLRDELLTRLRSEFRGWRIPADFAAVFGSAARGAMQAESDVDLFVVRPAATAGDDPGWRDQLDELSASVSRWTGNDGRLLELGAIEVASRISSGATPVLADILEHGLVVAGADNYLRQMGAAD